VVDSKQDKRSSRKTRRQGQLESREAVDTPADLNRLGLPWEAVLEFAVFNDGILTTEELKVLLAFHLDFKRGFSARNRDTIKVQNGTFFWFPTTTAGGLA